MVSWKGYLFMRELQTRDEFSPWNWDQVTIGNNRSNSENMSPQCKSGACIHTHEILCLISYTHTYMDQWTPSFGSVDVSPQIHTCSPSHLRVWFVTDPPGVEMRGGVEGWGGGRGRGEEAGREPVEEGEGRREDHGYNLSECYECGVTPLHSYCCAVTMATPQRCHHGYTTMYFPSLSTARLLTRTSPSPSHPT